MLGRSVKRPARRICSIQRNNGRGCTWGKRLAGGDPQKRVRAAQTKECMRFLPPNRSKAPVVKLASDVMRTVAVVINARYERFVHLRKPESVGSAAHQAKQRRPDKNQERHERRHRISGQAENRAISSAAEEKRFARLYRDPPKIGYGAGRVQSGFHQIAGTDRNAAQEN